MTLGFGLLELVTRASLNHLESVLPETLQHLLEVENSRLSFVERQQMSAERGLKAGTLLQHPQDRPSIGAPLELNHEANPVTVALVPDVGDVLGPPRLRQLGDLLDELGLGDRVGQLGDHELLFATAP